MNMFVLRCWLSRLSSLKDITKELHYLSQTKGWARLAGLPGFLFSAADILIDIDHDGPISSLYDAGWKDSEWSAIGNDWISRLLSSDRSLSCMKLRIQSGDKADYYPELGIVVVHESNMSTSIIVAPDHSGFRSWLNARLMDNSRATQQVIRMKKVAVMPQASWRGLGTVTKWGFDVAPAEKKELVRGSWAPSVEVIAKSMGVGKSILLLGPSGCGKTESAIQAALFGGSNRILVIPGNAMGSELSGASLASLMDLLGANVLVIDDLDGNTVVEVLEHFELLHKQKFSVAVTLMSDSGEVSLPGLRPGRIDQFFSFNTPSIEDRYKLLKYYAPDIDFTGSDQATRKFTPAYLKELANRAAASGKQGKLAWESAANSLETQLRIANQ